MDPIVSVIVTTYNRRELLGETINSILKQSFIAFEIIVVDNFSNYDFFEFINSFNDERIRGYQNHNDGVIAANRNYGIKVSNMKYIAFCDDDDLWLPDKLQKQVHILEKNNGIQLCCTNRINVNFNGEVLKQESLNWIPSKLTISNLLVSNFIALSSVLLRREIIDKVGSFSEETRFIAVEDYHLWLRIACSAKVFFLNEKLLKYRVHEANNSKKRSVGVLKTKMVYDDLFAHYKFNIIDKIRTLFVCYIKFVIYKLREVF